MLETELASKAVMAIAEDEAPDSPEAALHFSAKLVPPGPTVSLGSNSILDRYYASEEMPISRMLPEPIVAVKPRPPERFQLKSALLQTFEFLMLQHAFRVASFLVNGVGHPLQGAVASRIYLQNSPAGSIPIGKNSKYWTSRLKGMTWAAVFEVQWKVGPLSETSLGNAGGWSYVPGCGFTLVCLNNPKHPKPPTNNTGLSDWILTPTVGMGWVMLEDALDKYLIAKVAASHRIIGGKVLRTALQPSRSFAGLFMGKLPWQWPAPESSIIKSVEKSATSLSSGEAAWKENRRSFGLHYTNVSLPGVKEGCVGYRESNSGIGITYGYRVFSNVSLDTELNFFPAGASNSGPSLQGLFGTKVGHQGKAWGVFGKLRPGFIYYHKAWPGGNANDYDSLSRFALDAGGVVELYPNRRSTVRFDVGTTLVRYLREYPNPRISPLGSLQSPDYYVNQGNFQISSGYVFRF
jgi:hypothetical protein